jgi:predicted nucleic acid-binding protein
MDTNHVTAWEARNPTLIAKLEALPKNDLVYACAITLGEMEAGHEMTSGDLARRHQVGQFLNLHVLPQAIPITLYTRTYYGDIMGRLWRRTPPAKPSVSTDSHLVNTLGVNVNDVWIVACAWEHGFILLTTDAMTAIRAVLTAKEVTFDNWLI